MNPFLSRPARVGLLALCLLLTAAAVPSRAANTQPVSIKELCLLLRSGYTGDEVLRETATRPLLDPLDADAEKSLRQAGADAAFVTHFRTAHPALTGDEAAASRQRQEGIDQRAARARQAALPPGQPSAPAAPPNPAATADNAAARSPADALYLEKLLAGKLATFEDGRFKPQNGSIIENKKIIALYYSTYVSAGGRRFVSELVKFYRGFRPAHPEFELVVISGDRSVYDMENMMRSQKMPWPALAFEHLATPELKPLKSFADRSGAARLLLADPSGHVLADYTIDFTTNKDALVLADVPKVVADPTRPSALAPPHPITPPAGPAPASGPVSMAGQ